MGKNVIFMLTTMLYLFMCAIESLNSSTDEYALLAFKFQITSDPNKILAKNWSQGTSFCNWIGVTCDGRYQRVTGLNLANMGLGGTIAKEIGELSSLRSLVASNNNFRGTIPDEMGNLSQLREIEIQDNELIGSIPSSFGFLDNLQKLNVSNNRLSGNIPNRIFNISSLIEIDFAINCLSGSLPMDICYSLPKLEMLIISTNQISGNIPPSLGTCTNIKLLSMAANLFTGNIPMEIGNLSKLEFLILAKNNLTGTIPYSVGSLSNLKELYMIYNHIHGHIPQELGHLSNLEVLSSSQNRLEGEIPKSIFNLSMLQSLALGYNKISGNLPSSIGNGLPRLKGLYLSDNRLSGEIPVYVSNFSMLALLDISANLFSGRVPMNLGDLRDLEKLGLGDNQLTNDPSILELDFLLSLKNCRHLKILWISNNSFDGMLPKVMGNLSESLEEFHAYSCGIKGTIPREIGNMSNLILLGMGGNQLKGTILDSLIPMMKLQKLDLYENELLGSIPDNLCSLANLYYLNLENNMLSQQLPICLGNLTSLRELYLAYNSLNSTIPSTLWNNMEIEILSLSDNLLNGSLAPEIGNLKNMRVLYLSRNQFSGKIPMTIGQLQSLVNLTLSNNQLLGPIPESFANLISLQYLDLSENNLSGVIPKSLEKLKDIVHFNVSFNELSGEIPNGGPFKNLAADSFMGNSELCGASQYKVMLSCKGNTTRSSRTLSVLKYVLPSIALVVCLSIITICLMRRHTRNSNRPTESSSSIASNVKRISYYEVLNATNKFGEENLIGSGGIGSVYKGIFSNGMIVAIKVFNLDLEAAKKSFDNECQILYNIHHRNLVKVISSCSNLDLKALVLEYMPNGDLDKWLSSSNCCLDIAQRLEIMIDVAFALEYLHHGLPSPIVHCDLKPRNILLDEDMVGHVADFGITKLFTEDQRISLTKSLGTIGYMAPEYGSTGLISTTTDVYSYGIVLIETFTKKKPTSDIFDGEFTMRRWVFESFPNAIMQIVDTDLVNIVEENVRAKESFFKSIMGLALECTVELPQERPSMKDVPTRLKKFRNEFYESISQEK
ncbi:LRR receptor-like serine/threonine-protein kinase GSO2 isoform X2 [Olea europaea var. sylvestris]|uniref:non-specific serine/threonine protein kinase n=1 Tax=Olea europaea subsp. europaea TaxID=158383 RepID=A0A8S0UEH4_OLEEU|nr:LRR receptor-like serine/threonine-protein kinase GSO2 isoform X2 [Olea europaea var. sylvestris]CAA3015450.1 probable LRR receptor-like serine threonine-kinase At3g47570 [Olea europaea subsp. europaea]